MLRIRLFQSMEAALDDRMMDLGPKLRRFVAYLVLNAGHSLDRRSVGKALWPEEPSDERRMAKVNTSLHRVVERLGDEVYRLETESGAIRFNASGADVDVLRFRELICREDTDSHEEAAKLYRGELLEEWDELWLDPCRIELESQYRKVLQAVVKAAFQNHDYRKAINFLLQRGLPNFEWAWETLITARLLVGEHTEALGDYRNYLDFLHWESKRRGVALSPSKEMENRIKTVPKVPVPPIEPGGGTITRPACTPLPPLEPLGGGVPLDSPFYIERPQDAQITARLLHSDTRLLQSGQTLLIKGPRQIGKTSLLHRALQQAKQAGARVILSDWQNLAHSDLASDDAFFFALADLVAYQLKLNVSLEEAFRSRRAASTKFERFFRDEVLDSSETPVVWGIDEADRIFSCDFREDIYGKLRAWHNERSVTGSAFRRLTVIMAYSTEAHLFIRDVHMSPFNIGETVTLQDLTQHEVAELNERYGSPITATAEIEVLYNLTGGHPYLVRLSLHAIRQHGLNVAKLVTHAEQDDGIFAEHLARIRFALSVDNTLKSVVGDFIRSGTIPSEFDFVRLCASGLMTGGRSESMRPRCRLYELFLKRRLS